MKFISCIFQRGFLLRRGAKGPTLPTSSAASASEARPILRGSSTAASSSIGANTSTATASTAVAGGGGEDMPLMPNNSSLDHSSSQVCTVRDSTIRFSQPA